MGLLTRWKIFQGGRAGGTSIHSPSARRRTHGERGGGIGEMTYASNLNFGRGTAVAGGRGELCLLWLCSPSFDLAFRTSENANQPNHRHVVPRQSTIQPPAFGSMASSAFVSCALGRCWYWLVPRRGRSRPPPPWPSPHSPNPFGPAYALEEIPQERSVEQVENARSPKRNSGWSGQTVCTWEEFALSGDPLKKEAAAEAEPAEPYEPGVVDRLVDKVDAALSTKLKKSQIDEYKKAYGSDGTGTEEDPFVVKFLPGGKFLAIELRRVTSPRACQLTPIARPRPISPLLNRPTAPPHLAPTTQPAIFTLLPMLAAPRRSPQPADLGHPDKVDRTPNFGLCHLRRRNRVEYLCLGRGGDADRVPRA